MALLQPSPALCYLLCGGLDAHMTSGIDKVVVHYSHGTKIVLIKPRWDVSVRLTQEPEGMVYWVKALLSKQQVSPQKRPAPAQPKGRPRRKARSKTPKSQRR